MASRTEKSILPSCAHQSHQIEENTSTQGSPTILNTSSQVPPHDAYKAPIPECTSSATPYTLVFVRSAGEDAKRRTMELPWAHAAEAVDLRGRAKQTYYMLMPALHDKHPQNPFLPPPVSPPMSFDYNDAAFVGTLLSFLFIGVYITVFGLYVQVARVKKTVAVADYGLIALFVLTLTTVALDALQQFYTLRRGPDYPRWIGKINSTTSSLSMTLDFLSQIILIFRCWNVWGKVTWVAIPPAFLALVSWACGITVTIDLGTVQGAAVGAAKDWWVPLGVASMGLSLAVNALVSGLMISRIWYVYSQTKGCTDVKGTRLSWVASILLESAIALFVAQLIYLALFKTQHPAFTLVAGPVTIIYGLNCTAIMVRVGLNQSYETMAASTATHSAMDFAPNSNRPNTSQLQGSTTSAFTAQWNSSSQEKAQGKPLSHDDTETSSGVHYAV